MLEIRDNGYKTKQRMLRERKDSVILTKKLGFLGMVGKSLEDFVEEDKEK